MQYYLEKDQKLKRYVPIIQDSMVYPVVYDAKRTVLSLPPIINSAHSAVCHSRSFPVLSRAGFLCCSHGMYDFLSNASQTVGLTLQMT